MCNAEVNWVAWRGGEVGARAVRVADGVYIGRVHYRGSHLIGPVHAPQYRCHVVIFGRPFAFNCYDLLILANLPAQWLLRFKRGFEILGDICVKINAKFLGLTIVFCSNLLVIFNLNWIWDCSITLRLCTPSDAFRRIKFVFYVRGHVVIMCLILDV